MGSGRYTAVPSIDGLTKDTAVTALQDAGLSPDVQGQYSDAQPIDTVIGTDPASGSRVTKGSTVALLTSLGRPTVPPIPAGGRRLGPGRTTRRPHSRRGRRRDTFSSKIPIGGVAALDPAPGTEVAVGSSVKVITSKGSPPVDIPM